MNLSGFEILIGYNPAWVPRRPRLHSPSDIRDLQRRGYSYGFAPSENDRKRAPSHNGPWDASKKSHWKEKLANEEEKKLRTEVEAEFNEAMEKTS